jgi:hypothetical protein
MLFITEIGYPNTDENGNSHSTLHDPREEKCFRSQKSTSSLCTLWKLSWWVSFLGWQNLMEAHRAPKEWKEDRNAEFERKSQDCF